MLLRRHGALRASVLVTACLLMLAAGRVATAGAAPADRLLASIPSLTGADATQARTTYVGVLHGLPVSVAVVVRGGTAVAYVCDGRRVSAWLQGTASGGRLDLSGPGGRRLTGSVRARTVTGSVRLGGRILTFTATPAVEGRTGLFRRLLRTGRGSYLSGWIFARGRVRGGTAVQVQAEVSFTGINAVLDRCRTLRLQELFLEAQLQKQSTSRALFEELRSIRQALHVECGGPAVPGLPPQPGPTPTPKPKTTP
jgi:hypothetical protein